MKWIHRIWLVFIASNNGINHDIHLIFIQEIISGDKILAQRLRMNNGWRVKSGHFKTKQKKNHDKQNFGVSNLFDWALNIEHR